MQKLCPVSSCECTRQGHGALTWSFHRAGAWGGRAGRLILGPWKEGLRLLSTL